MEDLHAKNHRTGTRKMSAAENRTCIFTLRLSDLRSRASLSLFLRHHEETNTNVSYFLTNQSKSKSFINLKVSKKPVKTVKPTKNSTRPYLNEIPAHFIHDIKTKGYDVIGVTVFLHKLMRFPCKRGISKGVTGPCYTTELQCPDIK